MWEHGNSFPDADTLVALSRYFDVTTDYLLSRGDAPPDTLPDIEPLPQPTRKDRQITKINKELTHLNPKQLKLVNGLVREISRRDEE
jgi:transcriptional regulator with XRE-family HTH domain